MEETFKVDFLKDSLTEKQSEFYGKDTPSGEVRISPSGCCLPARFLEQMNRIYNFKVRKDDVWLCAFPKSGTTWVQEMIWLVGNDCNFEKAKAEKLHYRFVFLEHSAISGIYGRTDETIDLAENMASPRFIKCHLPIQLLPKMLWEVKPKIISMYRNPKDVAISYFHHCKMLRNYTGSLEFFLDVFLQDRAMYSPYWNEVLGLWEVKHKYNILFLTFEEMKKDLKKVARETAKFLNVEIREEAEDELMEHLNFRNMQKNKCVNFEDVLVNRNKGHMNFIREGKKEGWKKEMDETFIEKFDAWSLDHLKGTDFPYSY